MSLLSSQQPNIDDPAPSDLATSTESGYVLPMTALLLVPLMIFTAFSVDLGGWYLQAAEAQRAADSAALAAVVLLPDHPAASSAAVAAAKQNGFVDQPGCETLPCSPTAFPQVITTLTSSKSVRVTIMTEGDAFFGGVVTDATPIIERAASAEYVLPVPLGNPSSSLGAGNLLSGGDSATSEPWMIVQQRCNLRENGDLLSPSHVGPCIGAPNKQFDENGYYTIIDMPEATNNQTWNVELYAPGACWMGLRGLPVNFETKLYRADNTGFTDKDNINPGNIHPAATGVDGVVTNGAIAWNPGAGCNDAPKHTAGYTGQDEWVVANQIKPGDPRGRWVFNHRTSKNQSQRVIFALRVTPAAGPNAGEVCSTLDVGGTTSCPSVFAKDWLPVYASSKDRFGTEIFGTGEVTSFYLADVDDIHAGKTLQLRLFDPGEGMDNLQIISPNLDRYPLRYSTIDCAQMGHCVRADLAESDHELCATEADPATVPAAAKTTTIAGVYPCITVTQKKFNDRVLQIDLDLPDDYVCPAENCWWRIRYAPGSSAAVNDATTWSVRVIGDPVRLVD